MNRSNPNPGSDRTDPRETLNQTYWTVLNLGQTKQILVSMGQIDLDKKGLIKKFSIHAF